MSTGEESRNLNKRTTRGLVSIRTSLPAIAEPALRKRGFTEIRLITEWPTIVGEHVADGTVPQRLTRDNPAVLHLRVAPAFSVIVQHMSPQIIERITTFFGIEAVESLRYTQGPIPPWRDPPAPKPRPLSESETRELDTLVSAIRDEGLKTSLRRLGAALYRRDRK